MTETQMEDFAVRLRDILSAARVQDVDDAVAGQIEKFRASLRAGKPRRSQRQIRVWAAAAACVIAACAIAVLWQPRSAMARTIAAVRKAAGLVVRVQTRFEPSGTSPALDYTLWSKGAGSLLMDSGAPGQPIHQQTWREGNRVTHVDLAAKSAWIAEGVEGLPTVPHDLLQACTIEGLLTSFKGSWKPDGSIDKDSRRLLRYDHVAAYGRKMTLLVDPDSMLPVEMKFEGARSSQSAADASHFVMTSLYSWDEPVDDALLKPVIPTGIAVAHVDGTQVTAPQAVHPGIGVGNIQLGMSRAEVAFHWGPPDQVLDDSNDNYFSRGVQLFFTRDGLRTISCASQGSMVGPFKTFTGTTAEGAGLGQTEAAITKAMGEPDQRVVQNADSRYPAISLIYRRGITFTVQGDPKSMDVVCRSLSLQAQKQ